MNAPPLRLVERRNPTEKDPLQCLPGSLPGPRGLTRRSLVFSWLGGALLATLPRPALAQDAAIEDEFSVQRFNPAPGPRNYFTTRGVRTDGEMAWSAGLVINYANEPFTVVSCQSEENCDDPTAGRQDIKVIENLLTGDLMGSLTPIPILQVSLRVPLTWVKGQGITSEGSADAEGGGIESFGLGDPELEGKVRLHGGVRDPFVVGGALFVTGPLGSVTAEDSYIGSSTPAVGLRGIFDGEQGPFSFGGNLAGVLQGSGRVGTTEIGPEFRYGVAAGYKVSPVLRAIVDGFGGTRFSSKRGTNSLEVDAGVQILPLSSPFAFMAGLGTGLIEGVGVPKVRAFAGLMYVAEKKDRDGDGLWDDDDQCATNAEDLDGVEDSDGCPDGDDDSDSIAEPADKCPKQAEDPDGFQDTDGCPDPDNDNDGVLDDRDRCPDKMETRNGFKDDDGCPDEPDADGDGVPDARDKCPKEGEDTDGFQDTDGCPDPDNDGDGVPDGQDECADEPETKNGVTDEDGCPDEGEAVEPGAKPEKGKPAPKKP
jgi:OmpA-OmpF porin, OOP family